jgi:hypothetical protein
VPEHPTQRRTRSWLIALIAILAGGAVAWLGWTRAREQFFYSYLVAWVFWTGLSAGSLGVVLLHNVTGGHWGYAIRPIARAAAGVLPLMAILFVPIALNTIRLYEWADPYVVENDPALQHKAPYLNTDSFQLRAAIYFAFWFLLLVLLAWQNRSAPLPDTPADRRFRRLSGQGLALHGVAVTFASIDWLMSLEPHWFSSIYGLIVFVSQGLLGLAFAIVVRTIVDCRGAVLPETEANVQHDLGKLLLAFIMFWAYVAFSQFLLIWYGNLPEEVVWYNKRIEGQWAPVALALVALHFAVPFCLLLSRNWKRDPRRLGATAALVIVMDWVYFLWMVEPTAEHGRLAYVPWLDLGLTAAIGGVWWLIFLLLLPPLAAMDVEPEPVEQRHG